MKNILRNSKFGFTKWGIALVAAWWVFGTTGWGQTSIQNFGTTAASNTSATGNTTTIPNPTLGTTYARGGATAPNAPIIVSTTTPNPLGTTGAYLKAVASATTSVSKATPISGYTSSTEFYTSFKVLFGNSSGASGANTGVWTFYQGTGAMYTDANNFTGAQVWAGLQFTYGTSGAITLNYRNGSAWSPTSLTSSSLSQGTVYTVEIVANNKSSGTISYSYNGNSRTVAVQKFDLYINGTLVGDDLTCGQLTAGNTINAATFIGVSSTSNAANIFVDDFVVYNAVPSSIGGGAETTPAAPVVAAATGNTTTGFTANWAASSGTTKYFLDVATDSGFTSFVTGYQDKDVGNVTSSAVTGLDAGTTYYYRVRANNSAGTSASSEAQTALTTAAGTPSVTVSPTSAAGLTNYVGQVSAPTNYTVTGTNLGGTNLVVTASTNAIEVSTNSSTGFTNTFSLAPSVDGTLSNTVYVRISASAPVGAVNATVSNVSGSASNNFTISGTVTQPALTLVLSPTTVQESAGTGASTGTVGIPFSLTNDLTVSLVSSNTAAATVPSTVTITNGQTNATFTIAAGANTNSYVDATAVITASEANYISASATLTVGNVDVRVPTVVVNKFENTSVDVIELLVVGNGSPGSTVDMRGMLIKDHSSDNASDGGGKYVFSSNSLWQAVPAGTLIVLTLDDTATDANVDGFIVRVGLNNTTYFTKSGTTNFNLANTDMVMIKQAGSAEAGSVGMIHALANGASTQTQTAAAGSPKLVNNVGTAGVIYASNPNSTIADYNGSSVALGAAATIPFGSANNPANAAFIAGLRGTKDISISIEANAVIVNEDAGVQADKITVALSVAATSDLTVNLSATPAGIVNLPESVTIPAGSSSVTVGFTPINDNTSAGNRTVTIAGSADTWSSANNTVTVVDVQFTNPSVVINEVVNSSADSIELLVIQNNLSMVGMILKDFSGDMGGDSGGSYTFNDVALWQSVKAGTLVVLTNDATATEDTDASDGLITVKLTNTTYFTAAGSFAVSTTDMVMIKSAGSGASGIAGAIHTFGNGPAGSLFKLANGAKLLFTAGGAGGGADNATSAIVDYNGTGVTGGTATLGAANNANNQTFVTALRASSNSAPTDMALSSTSIAENNEVNASVGTLSTTDADSADTFTYSLVVGSGDTDNASFNISGNSLRAGVAFDFEDKSIYSIRVRTTDSANNTFEEVFSITVTDVVEGSTYNSWLNGVTPSDANAAMLDYAFGATTPGTLDPTLKPSVAIVPPAGGAGGDTATLVLTYYVRQNAVGLTVTPKTSADLAAAPGDWVEVIPVDVDVAREVNGIFVQQKTASVPVSGDRKFLRLEVLQE